MSCLVAILIRQYVFQEIYEAILTVSRLKDYRGQWILSHIMLDQHNHPFVVDPFALKSYRYRKPGRAEAIVIVATHVSLIFYLKSKKVLKKIGLEIDAKTYYNLRAHDLTRTLNLYDELVLLLKELEDRHVYVAVKEKYVLDEEGNTRDRVILCIAW
jgi:hypothetical protein